MDEIIKIVLNWGIPVVLAGILALLKSNINKIKEIKKDGLVMKRGLLSMIRSEINRCCKEYIKQGFLPDTERYCLEQLFEQYKNLGGNHGIEQLVLQCYELPPQKKE